MSAIVIFRVQDREGRGPFKPGFSHRWVEERADHANLMPAVADLLRARSQVAPGAHLGCGCRTLDDLRRWFTASEYTKLQRLGYRAVRMEVRRVLVDLPAQCIFERGRSLRKGVEAFDLYPVERAMRASA